MAHLVQKMFPVNVQPPRTTNAGFNSGWLDLSSAHKAYIVVHLTQAVGDATSFTVQENTGTPAALTNTIPIWLNENVAASAAMVRQTNANVQAVDANANNKVLVFAVDPDKLDDGNTSVRVVCSNSGEATNFVSIMAYMEPRYSQRA